MFEILEAALADTAYPSAFIELRYHDRRSRSVSVEDGKLETAKSSRHAGVGIRVSTQGAWGFSSTSVIEKKAITSAIDAAYKAALATAEAKGATALSLPSKALASGSFESDAVEPVTEKSLDEKIDLVMRADGLVKKANSHIRSSSSRYTELVDEKFIVTSDGARVHIKDAKPEFRVGAVAALEEQLSAHSEAQGNTGGFGNLFMKRSPEEMAEKAAKTATDLLRAGYVDGGKKQVILAPDVVGLLVHEAIGHTVEADFVLAGSAAQGKIGHEVASDLVTLCDSGISEYESGAGGVVLVDDEGVESRRTVIIENGILKSYLHNRETAEKFGVDPTGNARAFEYDNEPLIRMRNTYIEPGQTSLDEMIAGVQDGYLLASAKNGQADANAEFMFAVGEAYPIKNGKLGALHKGTTITGDAFDVLRSCDAVGDDFSWDLGSGYCGKGQPAKVDAGGPHIRVQVTLAGKES